MKKYNFWLCGWHYLRQPTGTQCVLADGDGFDLKKIGNLKRLFHQENYY